MNGFLKFLLTCSVLSIALTGCGGGGGGGGDGGGTTAATDPDKTVADLPTSGTFSGSYSGTYVPTSGSFTGKWSMYATSNDATGGNACSVNGHITNILTDGTVMPKANFTGTIDTDGVFSATTVGTIVSTISGTVDATTGALTATTSPSFSSAFTGNKLPRSTTRFIVSALKGTVYDSVNNLSWLKKADCYSDLSWDNAQATAAALKSGMCGLNDSSVAGNWRLPSAIEILYLVDSGFTNTSLSGLLSLTGIQPNDWTSTAVVASNDTFAWFITLSSGVLSSANTGNNHFAMFVRNGQ